MLLGVVLALALLLRVRARAFLGSALARRRGADLHGVAADSTAARLLCEPLQRVGRLVDGLQMAFVLMLPSGWCDVGMPDLGQPPARELDVALVERRIDLQQEDRLFDIQHLCHDLFTVAGVGPAARPFAPGGPIAVFSLRRFHGGDMYMSGYLVAPAHGGWSFRGRGGCGSDPASCASP